MTGSSKRSPSPAPSSAADVSRFQAFRVERLHRRELQAAPYNPRVMDVHAAKRLRDKLKAVGLVETIIFNRQTGNLVGGHQRLEQLDQLEGSDDYYLDVAVVALDPKTEKEMNVFLNNPAVQGSYDTEALAELFLNREANPLESGFEQLDLEDMFTPESVDQMLNGLLPPTASTTPAGTSPIAGAVAADVETIREARKAHKEGAQEALRADHYLVVIWPTSEHVEAFLKQLALAPDRGQISAEKLLRAVEAHVTDGKPSLVPVVEPEATEDA